jgi:hypothetical protein
MYLYLQDDADLATRAIPELTKLLNDEDQVQFIYFLRFYWKFKFENINITETNKADII